MTNSSTKERDSPFWRFSKSFCIKVTILSFLNLKKVYFPLLSIKKNGKSKNCYKFIQ